MINLIKFVHFWHDPPVTTLGVERGNTVDLQGIADSPGAARPKKPKWTQFRFVGGVLLVIGSVLLGAKIIAGADQSSFALVATRPMTVGMTITSADVTPVKVRLFTDQQQHAYLTGSIPPGYVVLRPVAAGELLPAAAIGGPAQLAPVGTQPFRWVTVPVRGGHYPPGLRSGSLVDIYTTANSITSLLMANVTVDAGVGVTPGGLGGGGGGSSVVLVIPTERVDDILTAMQSDAMDLVDVHITKVP